MTNALRAATSISMVTLGSRILGLVRDVMMFRMLGMTWAVAAFALAWMVPNMLRRLFGEGALSASFIPAYGRAREHGGPAAARALLASVTGWLLILLAGICAVVIAVCFFLPGGWVGSPTEEVDAATHGELLLRLTIILFPYAIPICLAAILTGALNTHGSFALPASAPIILNLFWIAGLGYAWATDMQDPAQIMTLVAVLLLIGGFAQLSLSLVPMLRRGLLPAPTIPGPGDPARQVLRAMGPTLIGMSLVQLNTMLDQVLANYLIDGEAPAFLYQANRLLLFPHALTSLALATAIFPQLATLGTRGDLLGLRRTADRAMHHTLMVALPAAVGMMLVAHPLIDVMLSGSRVTDPDIDLAALTTLCLVASLPMIGVAQLHARAFYALGDYRTPAWMSFWLLVLNLVLDLILVVGLGVGVYGFAIATTLAAAANAVVLRIRFRRRCPDPTPPARGTWRTLLAVAVMAAVVAGLLAAVTAESRWQRVIYDLLIPVVGGMLSYAGVQFLCGRRTIRLR